jgi:large subunit ribosomal protein L10
MSKETLMKKGEIVTEIKERFEKSKSSVLVDYIGLTVEQSTKLRKDLREAGIDYRVYKNTLTKRAIEGTDFAGLADHLAGSSAIAFSYEDETAPARILNKAIKDYGVMAFKAGFISGELYDADKLKELANIPSREVLLAKLLGSFKAPIGAFARLASALAEKKAEEGDAPAEVKEEAKAEAPAEETKAEEKPAEEAKAEEPAAEAKPEEVKEEPKAEESAKEEEKAEEPAKEGE